MTFISNNIEPGLMQREVAPSVRLLLNAAMKSYRDKTKSENLLRQAFDIDSSVLDTYVVYYKFYFYHSLLAEAERWVYLALENAAAQGGFSKDWQQLTPDCAFWDLVDGPERIYLYSLKALSFLRMKQGDLEIPGEVLAKLEILDPQDQVGWSVISQMRSRLVDDDE